MANNNRVTCFSYVKRRNNYYLLYNKKAGSFESAFSMLFIYDLLLLQFDQVQC